MSPDEEVDGLARWASRSHAADRSRLLLALANVVASDDLRRRPRAQACLDALLPALLLDADKATRAELAARLAEAPWAPAPLLAELANDEFEIARPLLARSPCIDPDTLTALARSPDPAVNLVLARRRALPEATIDALIERRDPDVMGALAANLNLALSPEQMRRLIEESRRTVSLRLLLTRRPELTAELAHAMAPWLSEAARIGLARRFGLSPLLASPADQASERRFVFKLQQSGRLTAGTAVRALRDGKLSLFEEALAALSGLSSETVHNAVQADDEAPLAQACSAAGVDRSVLPSIKAQLRQLAVAAPA